MNKTVLITGSSRGIGRAAAKKFAENNYNVVVNGSRDFKSLDAVFEELKLINKNILAVKADVSKYSEAKRLFSEAENAFGRVDVLVNNAGISYIGLFNEMEPSQWQNIMNINLNSVYNCTHIALPSMIHEKKGAIINISSMWGNVGASCEAVYSASKGGINAFTRALAKELGPSGIRVNSIACGVINTEMNEFLSEEEKMR